MKKLTVGLLLAVATAATAQDYIESFSHNTDFRGKERTLQYTPDADGYIVARNGNNRYTRALYGGPTLFRVETSDRPIFAAYHKSDNRNIHFYVTAGSTTIRLDSAATCVARSRGGERSYTISDPAWGKGSIEMTVVAPRESESAVWQIIPRDMPRNSRLTANSCATVKVKIQRSGDIGADPADCFAPDPEKRDLSTCSVSFGKSGKPLYIEYIDRSVTAADPKRLAAVYKKAQADREALTNRLVINTPDPYFNTLGSSLTVAADGIWDGSTWLHGAVGWRMPLSGWRAAYTGDFLGWHDRARTHFDAYAASQVTDVPPVIPHPAQDSTKNIARADKRWGTQMYSNGYICRNPRRNDQMHHYDMNLCYIDELMWHLKWTGDLDYARKMWPVITAHLAWEKRNFDPDDDGLYDAYCCIWASDALYYNSGAVTHSTAYNYRANKIAAEIAALIGEDPEPYSKEADKILSALNSTLWMDDKGVWAEFRDFMGHQRLHDHPGLWTVYHAIDSDVADPMQAYSATRYVDRAIPHIPVEADGLDDGGYATISTTDWLPYAWSINNVAFAEVMHTALAYWEAGRRDEAAKLLKSSMLDGMYLGSSPGNVGQVSYYDAARGECYRDFGDPVGVMSRAVVQGLFGFTPDALNGVLTIRPGFPSDWDHASIDHADFSFAFRRDGDRETYTLKLDSLPGADTVRFMLPALRDKVKSVKVNGVDVPWTLSESSVGAPVIEVNVAGRPDMAVEIEWAGNAMAGLAGTPTGTVRGYFREVASGDMRWWEELPRPEGKVPEVAELGLDLMASPDNVYEAVDLTGFYNSGVADIFRNRYESPRSPYTTLQIPIQGIGEWCHPGDTAHIDDSALRRAAAAGGLVTPQGIPFATVAEGDNVVYTSLFDNYPDSVTIPLTGHASGIELLMAGSTNHMQCYMENARVKVTYADGSEEVMSLVAPYNWAPIEQDYFIDGKAFDVPTPRPWRVTLSGGLVSDNLERDLGITGVYGRRIDGGAGIILCMKLDPERELRSLTLETMSNEVVVGLIAATYIRK